MRCEGIQEYLAERLAGSLSDRLSKTVYSHVRTHMLSCPECCEQMDDFEEMQKLLQTIPVEPCDSDFLRARFHLLLGRKNAEASNRKTAAPEHRIQALKVAFVSIAVFIAVIAAFLVARQAVKWISAARVVPPLITPVTTPFPKPVAVEVRTGAISGQIRANGEDLSRTVRVSVAAVPKRGIPSTEIAVDAGADGKFRLDNIPAGQYYVFARIDDSTMYYPGSRDIAGATIVSIQPGAVLEGMDFPNIEFAGRSMVATDPIGMAEITGRVLLDDGSEISDTLPLGEIAINEIGKSSGIAATTMRLDGNGRFVRTISAGEYRFGITEFSQNYLVRSMTSGGTDLMKEELKVTGSSRISVEVLVSRKNNATTGKVIGRVLDIKTNGPSQADRVVLCCFGSGPVERITTPLRPDGTFEFDGVPSGSYTAGLRGSRDLVIVNPAVSVSGAGVLGLNLISAPEVVPVDVTLRLDTGERLPYMPDTSIVFTETTRAFRVTALCVVGNLFRASVPADRSYALTVSNVAAGYTVQSIVDFRMTDLLNGGVVTATVGPVVPSRIVVTLTKN